MNRIDALRISGSGGANRAMEAELKRIAVRALGAHLDEKPRRVDEQNLRYGFRADLAWAALHYARTPSRILWDLATFDADRLDPLYEQVYAFVAEEAPDGWLGNGLGMTVEVRNIGDFPAGPLQVRGTVKNGVIEGARARGKKLRLDPDDPDLVLVVQNDPEGLRLSVDLGGHSLHRRGYRQSIGEAPLKENLAAQMLMLARWDARHEALFDPLMGAGTLPIEAALMATGSPHQREAPPVAHRLPAFVEFAKRPRPKLFPGKPAPIFGSDVDEEVVEAAKSNARRARVFDRAVFGIASFQTLDLDRLAEVWEDAEHEPAPLDRGLVICNPPYGERLGDEEQALALFEALVEWGQSLGPGWRFCFLAGHPKLETMISAQPRLKKPMSNGPIKAHVLVYDRLV